MFYQFSAYGFLKNLRFFDPFIILIFRSYGLSYLQIGFLYSIRDVATNILEIPTGLLADSFGRKKAMIGAFASYIVSFVILYFFKQFWVLALAMVLFASGEAFRSGTHKALILEYLKINSISDLKVAYYGMTRSASQMGSAFNALIAAGLVFYTGNYRIMFLAAALPYALDLVNLASYPAELDGKIFPESKKAVGDRVKETLAVFWGVFRNEKQLRSLLNSASYSGVFKISKDYLQPVLAAWVLSATIFPGLEATRREAVIIGLVYFAIYLMTSFASRRAYTISNRFSSLIKAVNITYLAGIGLLLAAGILTYLELETLAVLCFLGMFLINNIRRPINVGVISDRISSRVMASGLSAESQLTTIFTALFAPVLGYLVDRFGLGNGLSMLGMVMFLIFIPVRILDDDPEGDSK
ncbi:MAG TPA: MFS transporter [Chloroflexi bacterium]|nr:MAG: MFS transporter [Chloroflexota bacterium]HDD56120.1 MFS transporter [Chloroflexota bacterium]